MEWLLHIIFIIYNDLDNYATTNEVTNIVNTAIESGEIIVSGNPFKSINHYHYENNLTGITIDGSGIVIIDYIYNSGTIELDGSVTIYCNAEVANLGSNYYFNSSVKIYTPKSSGKNYKIDATVALFND